MEKWGKRDWGKWEICPKLSHFFQFFCYVMSISHIFIHSPECILAVSHIPPFFSISPHFHPFPPIFTIFIHLCG